MTVGATEKINCFRISIDQIQQVWIKYLMRGVVTTVKEFVEFCILILHSILVLNNHFLLLLTVGALTKLIKAAGMY